MKKLSTIFLLVSFPLMAQVPFQTSPTPSKSAYPHCGYDYNCYYQEMARQINQQRQTEKEELDAYRGTQLEMQSQELEEVQEQNELLDQQLQMQEERAIIEDERYEKAEKEQLEKQKQEEKERQENIAPADNVF